MLFSMGRCLSYRGPSVAFALAVLVLVLTNFTALAADPLAPLPDVLEKSNVPVRNSGFKFPLSPDDRKALLDVQTPKADKRFLKGIREHQLLSQAALTQRRNYEQSIVQQWQRKNYRGLEEIMNIFKGNLDPYFPGGTAVLPLYYATFSEVELDNDPITSQRLFESQIAEWTRAYPRSITPHLVLARYYLGKAWKVRGEGATSSISAERMERMRDFLMEADKVCETIQEEGLPLDPYFYTLELELRLYLSESDTALGNVFQQSITADPAYYPVYQRMAKVLLPRWRGDHDDLSTFALWSITHPAKEMYNKESLYAQIAETSLSYTLSNPGDFLTYDFSWPHIKAGFYELAQEGQMTTRRLNYFCWMAVQYKDASTSKLLFEALQDNIEPTLWSPESYQKAKVWALAGG